MAEIPNLVDLLPEAPTDLVVRFRRELARVLADCDFLLASRSTLKAHARPAGAADELLRIREACRRSGWTYSWAVKHWKALGGFKDSDGRLKIRADVLARHVQHGA